MHTNTYLGQRLKKGTIGISPPVRCADSPLVTPPAGGVQSATARSAALGAALRGPQVNAQLRLN